MIPFDNSFVRLPERFFAPATPTPVKAPGLIAVNDALAEELGIDAAWLRSEGGLSALAGNAVPDGAEPVALAYAGHQFGGWSPTLGDGRAILLGEVEGAKGRRDIQLKGAGVTPFSRFPDGRAALGPVIREYLISEAMAVLGVPTTRALAAVTTGQDVMRETPLPGAVLTRVASSHIRVGTFQYFAARGDLDALETLTAHALQRHYPEAEGALGLLNAVIAAQARLVAKWMGLGFIHGVMNTDNMSVAGETIDYGPCAFMDAYAPGMVFSSIDHGGRYAYANQPAAAQWNLAQLASALLPLIAPERDAAIAAAQAAVDGFLPLYQAAWRDVFAAKLGLVEAREGDTDLVDALLEAMVGLDFTQTFRALSEGAVPEALTHWHSIWTARLAEEGATPEARQAAMQAANPAIIPRNHQVEAVIQAAMAGDFAPFHALHRALQSPFTAPEDSPYRAAPKPGEEVKQTFCGT
ncbi:MAG: YdiU family protein [Pseudomonadota bacterium]